LEFLDPVLRGKRLVIQINNFGYDNTQDPNHLDLCIPGGGEGIYHGCSTVQFRTGGGYSHPGGDTTKPPWNPIWGREYGGVMYEGRHKCDGLPNALMRAGCKFFFDWLKGVDNPRARFYQVECPPEIVARTRMTNNNP
jgi:hypothetical protein